MVYIPEYVVSRWYEQLLHEQAALRPKSHLFSASGVMATSAPWQICLSPRLEERPGRADDRRELVGAGCEGRLR
jgi:hypothetical protein